MFLELYLGDGGREATECTLIGWEGGGSIEWKPTILMGSVTCMSEEKRVPESIVTRREYSTSKILPSVTVKASTYWPISRVNSFGIERLLESATSARILNFSVVRLPTTTLWHLHDLWTWIDQLLAHTRQPAWRLSRVDACRDSSQSWGWKLWGIW